MKNKLKVTEKNKLINSAIIFAIMFILLLIALLSFFPGIMSVDGNNQWNQVVSNNIIKNHPFFSTFVWWVLSKIWFSPASLMVFQILLLSIIWTEICNTLGQETKLLKKIIYTILMCLVPIIFMYAITAWKDIIYSYMLLTLALMFYIGIKKNFEYSYKDIFIISLSLVLIASYRYNGIIVTGISLIIFLMIFLKKKYGWKKILCSLGIFLIIFTTCKIPEKIMYHPTSETTGATNDIALFILSSVIVEDKIEDKNDLEIINKVYPIEQLKKEYNPYCINSMAFSESYNRENAGIYAKDIMSMLVKYAIKHPITIAKGYLKSDNILIGLSFGDKDGKGQGYVYIYEFSKWDTKYTGNFDEIVNPKFKAGYDFYLNLVNFSTSGTIIRKFYLPAVPLYLSIILMVIYTRKNKDNRYYLVLMPMILNTFSLLPINIAQDLRYAYINYLTLLLMVIPMILFDRKKKMRKNIDNKKIRKNNKVLVIIPAYNEALNIEKTIKDIKDNTNYDYIIINDSSSDNTKEICQKNKFNVLSLPVNYGLTSGIQLGMKYAKENGYDIAIQFDGDGQHQAKYLKKLVDEMKNSNADIVIGSRFATKKKPKSMRMFGSRIISICIKITTKKTIKDPTSGMRAFNNEMIDEFVNDSTLTPEPDTIAYMLKKGKIVKEVQVEMKEREFGESYLNPIKSIEYMANMVASIIFFRNFQD